MDYDECRPFEWPRDILAPLDKTTNQPTNQPTNHSTSQAPVTTNGTFDLPTTFKRPSSKFPPPQIWEIIFGFPHFSHHLQRLLLFLAWKHSCCAKAIDYVISINSFSLLSRLLYLELATMWRVESRAKLLGLLRIMCVCSFQGREGQTQVEVSCWGIEIYRT